MLPKPRLKWLAIPILASVLFLTGCSEKEKVSQGFLPGDGVNTTNHTEGIINLWNGAWIILLAVGAISWGLMAWAIIVYRRRKSDTSLPPQLRYNMPIETLFTVVPFILVVGFFAFTAKEMTAIETPNNAAVKIQAIGKQWSWDFNYVKENVYDSGIQYQDGANAQTEAELPTLYLPVNQPVEVDLTSRDVVHSFWVIDFLYKKDMFPGKTNRIYFTPTKVGTYAGKCAELCGEFHSMMLFQVKVVSQSEYDAHIAELANSGFTGQLDTDYVRNQNLPGNKAPVSNG